MPPCTKYLIVRNTLSMEYVYKLRLRTLEHLFKPSALKYFSDLRNSGRWVYERMNGHRVFKEQKFGDYYLDCAMLFYKNQGHKGDIHLDSETLKHVWGINWVISGTGSMDYWEKESIDKVESVIDRQNTAKAVYTVTKPPDKTYIMTPGVYLVYAGVPHRANGYGRMLVSARMKSIFDEPWEQVVNNFAAYILP